MTPARGEEREEKTREDLRGEGRGRPRPTHWPRTNIARLATEEGPAGDLKGKEGDKGRGGEGRE